MSEPVVTERDLLVLAKLLAMLGTENPHERAAFAAKAHAWVTQRGMEWAKLLIPPEPPEVEVSVNVGGRPSASSSRPPHQGNGAAQKPAGGPQAGGHSNSATGHNWARGPAWGPLVEEMLARHAAKLKGDREATFLTDQLGRAMLYGNGVRMSDKQEAWLRDILGRVALTW